MTNRFVWVAWNRHKRVYDAFLAAAVVAYLVVFLAASIAMADAPIDPAVVMIRATGSLAIIMLHVILCIGPLARFCDRVAPILYNRRHLGVTMFLVGLLHAFLVLAYYGGFGVENPVSAVLLSGRSFTSIGAFPFELLGFAGLLILFVMAATSHDFWLDLLGPTVWKWIHMAVYPAYFLLVGHAALGTAANKGPWNTTFLLLCAGVVIVATLHLLTGLRELTRDEVGLRAIEDNPDSAEVLGEGEYSRVGWVDIGTVDEIPEDRAKVVCLAGAERVAVFKHEGHVSAVSNVCAHQAGPLGEGKIVDGCITCPWHGYQYHPHNGQSPPPYTEKIPTYRLRVEGRTILIDPKPLAPGTHVEPAFFEASADDTRLFEDPDVERADAHASDVPDLNSDGSEPREDVVHDGR